jgi:hypothetical protein
LDVTISVLDQLMDLLMQRGLLDHADVKPLVSQLSIVKTNAHFTVDRSSMVFSEEEAKPTNRMSEVVVSTASDLEQNRKSDRRSDQFDHREQRKTE